MEIKKTEISNQQNFQESSMMSIICLGARALIIFSMKSTSIWWLPCFCFVFPDDIPGPQKGDHLGSSWLLLSISPSAFSCVPVSWYLQCTVRLMELFNLISALKFGLRFLWRQHNNFLPKPFSTSKGLTTTGLLSVLCPIASGWGWRASS